MQDLDQLVVYVFYVWVVASAVWFAKTLFDNRRSSALSNGQTGAESEEAPKATEQSTTLDLRTPGPSTKQKLADEAETVSPSKDEPTKATAGDEADADLSRTPVTASVGASKAVPSASAQAHTPATEPGASHSPKTAPDRKPVSLATPDTGSDLPSDQPEQPKKPNLPTIADLLTGIKLPFDLLPVAPEGEAASDQNVSLISHSAAPEVIGAAVADELERLGFSIHTHATDEAIAKRSGQTLRLQIYPDAVALSNETGARFPDASPGSVAIDLSVIES